MKKLRGPVIAAGAAALVLVPGAETLGNLGPGHSSGYLYKHIMSKLAVSAPKSRDNLFSPEQSSIWSVDRLRHQKPLPRPAIQARKTLGTNPSSDLRIGTVAGGFALRRRHMIGGPAIHKQIQRVMFVVIAAIIGAALAIPVQARAETPLSAFCADNADRLQRTSHESGLDPAQWASDPRNLARFGFQGPGDIDTLYHMVIDKGAPYITSHWSNENDGIEWRCAGQ